MEVMRLAKEQEEYIIQMRRDFHMHPELSLKEYRTSAIVIQELEKIGIPHVKVGETGIVGTLKGSLPGKTIALRADMDALPVLETNDDIEYKSKVEGCMHACGHDGHTACLLGAAKILVQLKDQIKGTIKLIFEPAEEIGGSFRAFEEAGVLEGIDSCFAAHIWADIPVSKVTVAPGPRMAGTDFFTLRIMGQGGHGSMPHQGVDAIVTAAAVIQNLQTIVSREMSPFEPCVVTIGKLTSGQRFNVIADEAILEGNLRTFNPEIRASYKKIIERIVKNTCEAFRADYEWVSYTYGTPPVINTQEASDRLRGAVIKLFGEEGVGTAHSVMAGEDFSLFMEKLTGCFAFVGGGNTDKGCCYPHHHGKFNIDEDALLTTTALYSQYALDFLNE